MNYESNATIFIQENVVCKNEAIVSRPQCDNGPWYEMQATQVQSIII